MKYLIYLGIILLVLWAVWYLIRQIRRQMRGDCGCGGDCAGCGAVCDKK